MLRAVTFDCWGTLIADSDTAGAARARTDAVVRLAGGRVDAERARALLERAWTIHHDRWLAGEQFGAPGIAKLCVDELALGPDAEVELCHAFEEAGESYTVEPLPGAGDTLELLRSSGVPTALVCDTGYTPGRVVRRLLARHRLELDHYVFSDEVGVPKPDPRMFHTALDAIDAQPRESAHVGDLLQTDIKGGRAVGMRTIRITGYTQPNIREADGLTEADEVVASHAELPDALRRLGLQV